MGQLLRMVAVAAMLAAWNGPLARGAEIKGRASEYELKAAFIFNFTQFVEWPTNAFGATNAPFVIGILGADPFQGALDRIVAGEQVRGHPLRIERFPGIGELRSVHILFISRGLAPRLAEVLGRLEDSPTLTVSDIDRFAERGGMIQLATEQNQIRMRINAEAARHVQLNISSKLLRLAQPGRDPSERGGP